MNDTPRRTPRQVADAFVESYLDVDPVLAEMLGTRPGSDLLPDYSPDGAAAVAGVARQALAALDATGAAEAAGTAPVERRAARLLRDRAGAELALVETGERLADLNNLFSPSQQLRTALLMMPKETADDWAVVARRMRRIPEAVAGYRAALDAGLAEGIKAAPRQAETVVRQLADGSGWYRDLAASGPEALRAELDEAASAAVAATEDLRGYLADRYLPAVQGTPDAVGAERYARFARRWTGSDLDLADAYAYGWEEYRRIKTEMAVVAEKIVPGATPRQAMDHLNKHGEAVEGEENIRVWLQEFMDRAIHELDGTHFDLADRVKRVESMIAPPGAAAAAHYTPPSMDFSRPGRTWLPTLGETRFPLWFLVSTWYHEGVPGHHLQLAQWCHVADELSTFQTTLGSVSATTEGWALYAERFADELGLLSDPADRLGYLAEQMTRAIRVIIDIGMHCGFAIPDGADFHPGETWTPALASAFMGANTGMEPAYLDSEITRYLGLPGQAISYKLGERAWLAGREAARRAHGASFDLKDWHMKALSLGSLGLDDLADELGGL